MATINNYNINFLLSGTNSDDSIYNGGYTDDDGYGQEGGDGVTVDGGKGDDTINNGGLEVSINGGGGNDSIYNWGPSVTIDGSACNDSITNWNGGDGNDYISNNGDSATIDAGAGDDTVSLGGNYHYSSGQYVMFVTIDGGTGNDFICAEKGAESVSINGGDGKDTISCPYAKDVTILGGVGNDLISIASGENNLFQYSLGDGENTIYGFNSGDSIQLLTDSKITANMSSNDVVFKIGDTTEAITLKDVLSGGSAQIKFLSKNGDALKTYNFNKNTGVITDDSDSITLTSPFSGTFDASNYTNVDASTADNKITLTSGKTNSVTLSGGSADDSIENFTANSSLVGGEGNDTITNKTSYTETVTRQVTETI
jgi:hypothetical protein